MRSNAKAVKALIVLSFTALLFSLGRFIVSAQTVSERIGVVVVGHGVVAKDFPPEKLSEFFQLAGQVRQAGGEEKAPHALVQRLHELEREMRQWKRTPENDPYDAAVKELAARMKELGKFDIAVVAHNEACGLDVDEGISEAIRQGAKKVVVVSTMVIKGGGHAERDIPAKIEKARKAHPNVPIIYAWPFETDAIAKLMVAQVNRFTR